MNQNKYKVNWKPLEDLATKSPDLVKCEDWMYMYTFEQVNMQTGEIWEIHLYKNIMTRRYLNLDESGNFFKYRPESNDYREISAPNSLLEL